VRIHGDFRTKEFCNRTPSFRGFDCGIKRLLRRTRHLRRQVCGATSVPLGKLRTSTPTH